MNIIDITNTNLSTEEVAKQLLGLKLISETPKGITSGWIVETEAYLGSIDRAAHTYKYRKTPRVKAMYDQAGTIYLYSMRGHILLNIVTKEVGNPEAVLIRGIQPDRGFELMKKRRGQKGYNLTNGPGKLSQAMGITMAEYGRSITKPPLYIDFSIQRNRKRSLQLQESVFRTKEWTKAPLRFIVEGNPYVSGRNKTIDKTTYGWEL